MLAAVGVYGVVLLGLALPSSPVATPQRLAYAIPCSNIEGDWDINLVVTIGDAQRAARWLIHLADPELTCPWDVDCGGSFNIGDAVKIARYVVSLPYSQHEPCPDIGQAT